MCRLTKSSAFPVQKSIPSTICAIPLSPISTCTTVVVLFIVRASLPCVTVLRLLCRDHINSVG